MTCKEIFPSVSAWAEPFEELFRNTSLSYQYYKDVCLSVCLSVCTTDLLLLINGKSFRPAVFCKPFLSLSIRFLNKNIHRENRESVIWIVILCVISHTLLKCE